MTVYSGNKAGWLSNVAAAIMDGGSKPPSMDVLVSRVPREIGTARNDGHVTAAKNGLDREDYKAGYRIWVEGAVAALREAGLVDGPDSALKWLGKPDEDRKVPFAGNNIMVFGLESRKASRDRYMLGKSDGDEAREAWEQAEPPPPADYVKNDIGNLLRDGRVLRGDIDPLPVKVLKRYRGEDRIHDEKFEIHPLALAIPPMTEAEQKAIRDSIEANGVKVPIVLYPDKNDLTPRGKPKEKVLDGRHRVYFASILKVPVTVEYFDGTEKEARDHVADLNLHRRHLTRQQRGLSSVLLFGKQAKIEAEADMRKAAVKGNKSRSSAPVNLSEPDNGRQRGKEVHERVWEMAGGEASGFSKADAKAMMEVAEAPETREKVESGELKNTSEAKAQAKAEKTGTEAKAQRGAGKNVSAPRSPRRRLGTCRSELKALLIECEDGEAILAKVAEKVEHQRERTNGLDVAEACKKELVELDDLAQEVTKQLTDVRNRIHAARLAMEECESQGKVRAS